jgi:hypothetical protein
MEPRRGETFRLLSRGSSRQGHQHSHHIPRESNTAAHGKTDGTMGRSLQRSKERTSARHIPSIWTKTKTSDHQHCAGSGEALRRMCGIPRKLPSRLYDLVAQLRRATKGGDYRHNAVELMRLAERAHSPAEKTRLVTLAEGWVELAEKAHEDNRRTQQPTILHPLVARKLGKLPD